MCRLLARELLTAAEAKNGGLNSTRALLFNFNHHHHHHAAPPPPANNNKKPSKKQKACTTLCIML